FRFSKRRQQVVNESSVSRQRTLKIRPKTTSTIPEDCSENLPKTIPVSPQKHPSFLPNKNEKREKYVPFYLLFAFILRTFTD
ncbi:hypothetical protein, partial [Bacteroides sp.]|uniref:hypothetical protein n=1 Tax=Bacteroides sp. TaxID=29523 RepID=UPI001B4E5052